MAIVVLAVGGWIGYQQYTAFQARKAGHARQVASTERLKARQAELAAKQHAFDVAAEAARKKQIAAAQAARQALDAARQEIQASLKPMKVTSILPGNPGLAIIDKTEYAEGDNLALSGGRRLVITAIRSDGVSLAGNGMTFHLDPPAAPDLAALRKGR